MQQTKNIVMILYGYYPSDTRVRKEIYSLTKDKDNSITLLCLKEDEKKCYVKNTKVISLMPKIIRERRESVFSLLTFWILVTIYLLKQNSKLTVHAHDLTGLPPIILPKILGRINFVVYDSHELFLEAARDELGWIFWVFFLILEKVCMYFVDIIIGISNEQKLLMQKRYNKKYILLPNYPLLLDIKKFEGLSKTQIKEGYYNLIYHGAIRKDRKITTLLDVLYELNKKKLKVYLTVIGDGPFFKLMLEYAKLLNLRNISFLGKQPFDKTFQYLKSADIAIALYEVKVYTALTCSNKLYECMAAGIPSIFSDLKGSREVMNEAGIIRVNPYKKEQIISAIDYLIKNKKYRDSVAKKGIYLIKNKYNWEKVDDTLIELYQSI